MSDQVFQCDFCGEFVELEKALMFYVPAEKLSDGRIKVIVGTYCTTYCGEQASDWTLARG